MNKRDKIRLLNLLIEQEEQQEEDIIKLKNELMLKLSQDILRDLRRYQLYMDRKPIITGRSNRTNIKLLKVRPIHFVLRKEVRGPNDKHMEINIQPEDRYQDSTASQLQFKFAHYFNDKIKEAITDDNDYDKLESAVFDCIQYLDDARLKFRIKITEDYIFNDKNTPLYIWVSYNTPASQQFAIKSKKHRATLLSNGFSYSLDDLTADNLNEKQRKIYNDFKNKILPAMRDSFDYINEEYVKKMTIIYNIFKDYDRLDLYKILVTQ